MQIPDIRPEWRTSTVVALCNSMRAVQDFAALPILADALQDAGCDDEALLSQLRGPVPEYPEAAAVVASVLSEETATSVAWLVEFTNAADCPMFATTFAAATGHHDLNRDEEGYCGSENDGEYLMFWGRDAHSEIPPEFWDHVEKVAGKPIPGRDRVSRFACSC